MRNPITRKKPPTPWGENPKIQGFGTTENPFNAVIVDQLNLILGVHVEKVPGTKFKSGLPDIMGMAWDQHVALENKFIQKLPSGDYTVAFSRKEYRAGQIEFFERHLMARAEFAITKGGRQQGIPIIGSLVGVLSNPRIIFGVAVNLAISEHVLYAHVLHECVEWAAKDRCPFFFFDEDYDNIESHASLSDLMGRF